jgi:hypothetical protein
MVIESFVFGPRGTTSIDDNPSWAASTFETSERPVMELNDTSTIKLTARHFSPTLHLLLFFRPNTMAWGKRVRILSSS